MLGDVELVKHYLDLGLDANSKLARGFTKGESWLMAAISSKNSNIVKLLLDHGANLNGNIEFKDVSPLHRASAIGCQDICKVLIDRGADVNTKGKYGKSPLYFASQFGHKDVVEFLLDCGADVNALDFKKSSSLFVAAQNHHLEVVKSLLSRGAQVNVTDDEGWTPLLRAFQKSGGDEIIKILINHSANVNVRGCGGESPLHIAVAQGNKNIVEFLLAHGAREGL
ncbi:ankyrin repeat domain-containing protein [Nostoc sp. 'Peltigera malacea cyanobiont' DB3992]|uniref:ankyrin repeat domain-containing protein n=1 Tax=Nostoc sp. 'Peltigera malacea cyanobiont' DB3992 TaxID=1206980 RepID=UPI000C04C773|nr:ankyrin repeat domain-containing protein [Nostoc sp. 'Peltigera malacea cyanobiont' DB3992]PHM08954.1 hypothetical protein CK516_17555 [Nostoc sp. 'Peltigera malacea cyanobiont' DB3992]